MPPFSRGYGNLVVELAGFIHKRWIFPLHANRAATSADVSGQAKQFLYMDHLDAFVAGGLGGLFQVKLTAYGDTEYIDPGSCAPGNQSLIHLFWRHPDGLSCMGTAQVIFVKFVKSFLTRDL